ncbi:hypothetical protein [Caulobacter sp. D4A]|uniref:hypothetical protein n=1 Tax=Caulobacter sp. D4A TaxID=2204171 RepID=UPI0018EEB5E7|nr:hypothetical protein [Caulobacter sp. D4A]
MAVAEGFPQSTFHQMPKAHSPFFGHKSTTTKAMQELCAIGGKDFRASKNTVSTLPPPINALILVLGKLPTLGGDEQVACLEKHQLPKRCSAMVKRRSLQSSVFLL